MAYRRFPLPALKLTQRPTFGQKSLEVIQRGVSDSQPSFASEELRERPCGSPVNTSPVDSPLAVNTGVSMLRPLLELEEPTGYELESRASVGGWERVRSGILTAVTEAAAMPVAQFCISCEKTASLLCQQCGPLGYFCPGCFDLGHHKVNILHVAEKWEVSETVKSMIISVQCSA